MQPFSQACENNKSFILPVLERAFASASCVLEVGSGTGQHAVYFAPRLPQLIWQTSDLPQHHAGILNWLQAYPAVNLRAPLTFDLREPVWPEADIDAVFSANTAHIVSWPLVQTLFRLVGQKLPVGGSFVLYGPFNYGGQFTSDSNRQFDQFLQARDPASGIRDIEALVEIAAENTLMLAQDIAMPANNRCLLWQKMR